MGVISSTLDEHVVLVDKKLDAWRPWRTLSENSESSMKAVVPNTVRNAIADAAKSYADGQEEVNRQISCVASQLTAVQNTVDSVAARCCAFDTRLEAFERLVFGAPPTSSTSRMASSSNLRAYSLSESIVHTQEILAQLTASVAEARDEARLGKKDFLEMLKGPINFSKGRDSCPANITTNTCSFSNTYCVHISSDSWGSHCESRLNRTYT